MFCVVREQEIAQWVELPAEKPGAILTRVRVLGVARDFLLPESASCADSLTVLVQSPCDAVTPINICTHVKKAPNLATIPLFQHAKILNTLVGMGSAAPAAAVPYPDKATRISRKELWSTKNVFKVRFLSNVLCRHALSCDLFASTMSSVQFSSR